jgi:hypothetical protein
MPVFYNVNEEEVRQNGQPNFGNNANFRNYCNPNNSDTDASSTGHHIGNLFCRHRINQAKGQNDGRQKWFQQARNQQNREQGNNVFDCVNRQNKHYTETHHDQQNQGQMGQDQQYH